MVSYLEAALAAGTASHLRYDSELAVKYVELALSGQPGAALLSCVWPRCVCAPTLQT